MRLAALRVCTLAALVAACAPARPASAPAGQAPAAAPAAPPAAAPLDAVAAAKGLTWDELHARALAEGGTLSFYGTLSAATAEKIVPAFEQRFPGVKVDQVDATGDRLVSRVVTEARGGKVLADVVQIPMENIQQVNREGLLHQDIAPPEALPYPDDLRGKYWVATDLVSIVAAWNTNLVRPDEVPRQLEDLADPRWKDRLIAEPRDAELLIGLERKLGSEERAVEVLRRIAANNVEFHKGHSELAELLLAGQAAVCLTCYTHHFPSRIRRGAPVDYILTEGIGIIAATAVLKDAPHPYTAMLWLRWALSEEGQQAYGEGGRTPAHPSVAPRERTRPEKVYALGADEIASLPRYLRVWNEVFQLR